MPSASSAKTVITTVARAARLNETKRQVIFAYAEGESTTWTEAAAAAGVTAQRPSSPGLVTANRGCGPEAVSGDHGRQVPMAWG